MMLQLGWGWRNITPSRPAMLQGQRHVRVASSALDPLTVTALAIKGDGPSESALFVSCDLAYPSDGLYQQVRHGLRSATPDLPEENLILTGTHTHTSLVIEEGFYDYPGGDVMTPAECREWVAGRIVEAATEAWERCRPHLIGRAFGHAVVGHNRRAVYEDGSAQMYGKTNREDFCHIEGYEDHSVDMLFIWEKEGVLSGVALAIPCPSQVDENISQFSADYWHEVRVELRKRFGEKLYVLPWCGAAGDQSPHFLLYGPQEAEMRRRRGVTEREEIAQRVADAVERALACTKPEKCDGMPFAHRVRRVELTPRQISRAERDWAQVARERWIAEKGEQSSWWPQRLLQVVEQHDGVRKASPVPVELHVVRLGDMAIATNPFELFLDYGLRIKARSPAAQTVVVQLAGMCWYLPTARAVQGGGYGAMPAVSVVGPEGGAELVRETLSMIQELFR